MAVSSGPVGSLRGMGARFIGGDREQVFLMPPSVRDWVPEGHLVWTVLEAVAELDLSAMYAAYRADGHGRPAYEPSMMVALLLYAYARGNRSSRGIERACVEDVAYRVVAGNLVPDHSTIAEFRVRHERPLADVFSGVLGLCARAGLASVGVVAIDGTKVAANASLDANRDYEQIAREILAEAAGTDRREDELYGEARGDELPEQLRTSEGRRAALLEAKAKLEREAGREAQPDSDEPEGAGVEIELDPERFVTRSHGRRAWFREARRALDERRGASGALYCALPSRAARRVSAPVGGGARGRALGKRGLRGVAPARGRRGRLAPDGARHDQALPAAGAAGGDDQHDRPRLAARQDGWPAGAAGLQRAGGGQRAADRGRRRGDGRLARLRPPRADGRCNPARARDHRRGVAGGGRRRRRLLAQAADGESR